MVKFKKRTLDLNLSSHKTEQAHTVTSISHCHSQVNPLRVKKLHVLAALEVDKFKKKTLDLNPAVTQTTATGRTMQTSATMQNTAAQTLNSELLSVWTSGIFAA